MQHLNIFKIIFWLMGLGFFALGPGALTVLAEVSVEASISHSSFPVNRPARLTVTISGTRKNADINIPKIKNIHLQNRGSSSQISMINGSVSSSVSHSYLLRADQPGTYTIPPIEVRVDGKTYDTKQLSFQVTPTGNTPKGYSGNKDPAGGESAFIRISQKSASHYPGEIVPLTIKAYFTQAYRADINSLPTLKGDGVVMSQLPEQPQQTEESVKGRKYHVLTWETSLAGVKVGKHPLHFSLDATLLIPQRRKAMSPFGGNSLFNDPFFNDSALDSFFGSHKRQPVVSVSPEIMFTVLPLPTDRRPANFTGAIGDFELEVTAKPLHIELGEPITLTMEISGRGNFDRVEPPVFPESPDWKTYSPAANFTELGSSYSGTKVFEQAVVARNGAITEIPPLSFSYFDPDKKRYITKTSRALAIQLKDQPTLITTPPPP